LIIDSYVTLNNVNWIAYAKPPRAQHALYVLHTEHGGHAEHLTESFRSSHIVMHKCNPYLSSLLIICETYYFERSSKILYESLRTFRNGELRSYRDNIINCFRLKIFSSHVAIIYLISLSNEIYIEPCSAYINAIIYRTKYNCVDIW